MSQASKSPGHLAPAASTRRPAYLRLSLDELLRKTHLEGQLLTILRYFAAGIVVLVVPGYAWLVWFSPRAKDLAIVLARAMGLSISFSALFALAMFFLGWSLSSGDLIVIYTVVVFLAGLGHFRRTVNWRPSAYSAMILVVFAVILGWRFYQVRTLALPAWVDSLHHVLIVRKLLETGILPQNLLPYMPVPFYYHFAFHVTTWLYAFWSGLTAPQAVLGFGQVLNAAVALSVYRLGIALWQDWRRAGLAAILIGFVSEMPAYYASWGRYTLLTGMLLLPLAMASALEIKNQPVRLHQIVELALLTAGVLLTHYFAGLLLAIFLIVVGWQAVWARLRLGKAWDQPWRALIVGGLGGLLLASPWLLRLWTLAGSLFFEVRAVLPAGSANTSSATIPLDYLWSLLGPTQNQVLIFIGAAGLIFAALRAQTRGVAIWSALLGLCVLPWGLRLGPFRPDHFAIVLFLPVCLLASECLISLLDRLGGTLAQWPARLVWSITVVTLCLWGIRDTSSVVNASTALASSADLQALQWIDQNIPLQARFLSNATLWQTGIYRGADGGYWIMSYTGRQQLVPPLLYTWGDQDYARQINDLAEEETHLTGCSPEFWDLVNQAGITHVYVSSGQGSLRPDSLISCAGLRLLYQKDGVYIWEVSAH